MRWRAVLGVAGIVASLGATVDVRRGKVKLFAIPKAGKPVESALFYDGIFKLKLAGGITELQLTEALSCPKAGKAGVSPPTMIGPSRRPLSVNLWRHSPGSSGQLGSDSLGHRAQRVFLRLGPGQQLLQVGVLLP